MQVSPGTPIGLGDINLRVAGDLYLYKDPGQPISVTGSFDSVSGTYTFQGRRFDVVETSSINFRGDLNPEIYVTVTRLISGVDTRVSIIGPMRQPELRLSSTPPLDASDILSLIVFNTGSNQLSSAQQQELLGPRGGDGRRVHHDAASARHRESARPRDPRCRGARGLRDRAEGDHRSGDRAGPGRALQPAVRAGPVRRGDDRILPVTHPASARHVLRCTDALDTLALPTHRARRD